VWLSATDHELYYSRFSNGALWPLCHIAYVRPVFRSADWERYRDVNRRFAEAVLQEIGSRPALVFIQDYHLALAAQILKEKRPDLHVALFWHIPWPNPEVFRILPWRREILEGMLPTTWSDSTCAPRLELPDSVAAIRRVDREGLWSSAVASGPGCAISDQRERGRRHPRKRPRCGPPRPRSGTRSASARV
jgi:hypothetical protein